ncbi:MAG: c-type cytochrome [Pirellulaceae bacterium]|nr:c-type cytochrome [Pirellulaceae bacterium]
MNHRFALAALICLLPASNVWADKDRAAEPKTAAEIYGQGVRETEARTPEQEQAGFHLPDGFEAQLFASEPQIAKPLNMAWDTRGRLWITNTIEYPYPAKPGTEPRDSIKILEDTDGDGRADKVTTFADKLNIPMGLLPTAGGVICFNIPDIVFLRDNDGDDKADERIKILGPFDTTRDTHGMVNGLRRGPDGWIYACHGFNNQSNVTAKDGSSVKLISGNTLRFRDDGSRVEQWTMGQVNPFGLAADDWGNLYSADCHSKPITALLRGGCYPSFGRPHDGLGFAPSMMDHLHGSTAICGLIYYQADQFPAAFQKRFYSGNVMTSRINCNAIERKGATVTARELPDFMTSDDPWFRPVDIQLGPDGAMYVADFYNKIIGHYEVPLEHPGRDRESGRIWRIVYRGKDTAKPIQSLTEYQKQIFDAATLSPVDLEELGSSNLTRRELAIERARQTNLHAKKLDAVRLKLLAEKTPELERLSCLAILWSRGELRDEDLVTVIANGTPRLQVDALRAASQPLHSNASALTAAIRKAADSPEPQVRLAAIEAFGRCGNAGNVRALLNFAKANTNSDPTLRQAARIAVRSLMRDEEALKAIAESWQFGSGKAAPTRMTLAIDDPLAGEFASILPSLDSSLAAEALLRYVDEHADADADLVQAAIAGAAKRMTPTMTEATIRLVKKINGDNSIALAKSLESICVALAAQNANYPDQLKVFAGEVAQQLRTKMEAAIANQQAMVDWRDTSGAEWNGEARKCSDGQAITVLSSLTRGEAYVGTLASSTFACPADLEFWLCGHNGNPSEDDHKKNLVRLVDAELGTTLQTAFPPRSDIAVAVKWSGKEHVGRPVRIEVVDGDKGNAYAWLGVGRFSVNGLNPSNAGEVLAAINPLLRRRITPAVTEQFETLLASAALSPRMRAQLTSALAEAKQQVLAQTLAEQALEINQAGLVNNDLLSADQSARDAATKLLAEQISLAVTNRQQTAFATRLLRTVPGCSTLVQLLDQGKLSLRALRGKETILPEGCSEEVRQRLKTLIQQASELPDENSAAIAARVAKLNLNDASVEQGKLLFEKSCAVCHQLAGKGTLVGPQLDGVGKRGVERLGEDILDPSRNVDTAFRMSTLLLEGDRVVTGLIREQPDGSLQVVGQDGKATTIAANTVEQRRDSSKSLMPENFAEVLGDAELSALLKYMIAPK